MSPRKKKRKIIVAETIGRKKTVRQNRPENSSNSDETIEKRGPNKQMLMRFKLEKKKSYMNL